MISEKQIKARVKTLKNILKDSIRDKDYYLAASVQSRLEELECVLEE